MCDLMLEKTYQMGRADALRNGRNIVDVITSALPNTGHAKILSGLSMMYHSMAGLTRSVERDAFDYGVGKHDAYSEQSDIAYELAKIECDYPKSGAILFFKAMILELE